MDLREALNRPYSWPMHDFRKHTLLAFAALIFFTTTVAALAQTQTSGAGTQPSTGTSTPVVAPQVRPAFPQGLLPAPKEQDAAFREKAEADKARREAQAKEEQRLAQETQARGYWVDTSTGLMWAGKDNGNAVTWHKAVSYCRNLQLAGYSNWRLATLDELASLVDKSTPAPERVGNIETFYINVGRHVRGGLSLAGNPWSSIREIDRFGHPYGDGAFFDFVNSKPSWDLQDFRNIKYALCVRRTAASMAPTSIGTTTAKTQSPMEGQSSEHETQALGFWTDPTTGLMWAAKDSGKDVSWGKAMKYCRILRLAGYSDWRLATISELEGIYDKNVNAPGLARLGGPAKGSDFTWHVKGNLFLTGNQWSRSQRIDDRGHPDGYARHFDFNEGRPNDDPTGFPYPFTNRRALCVRGSGK